MQVEEIALRDPGQDGPPWTWVGPGFPPEGGEHIRRECAEKLLGFQRRYCMSGDPIHALTAWTWSQLYHVPAPPWVEAIVGQLAWTVIMAPISIRGRRRRRTHWVRYAAVRDHLRQQQTAGAKRPSKQKAFREVSAALRGQVGRGSKEVIAKSYRAVDKAVRRRGGASQLALGALDRRYRDIDIFDDKSKRPS
jgi:hypothetical protein